MSEVRCMYYSIYRPLYVWTAGVDLFGFLVHYPEDVQEKLLVFQLPSSEGTVTKEGLLTELCSLIAQLNNSSDTVSNLICPCVHACVGRHTCV